MAWVAVDMDGEEYIYHYFPYREGISWWDGESSLELPNGSIEKLIGKKLTWEDEPVELKEDAQNG